MNGAPPVLGILETAIYADSLEGMRRFYAGTIGLRLLLDTPRMLTFAAAPGQVLLVFRRGMTEADSETEGGIVPGHHGDGPAHFAFSIAAESYGAWKAHLEREGVSIRSEVTWPRGGKSLYFDDPAGNVVELATPGLWPDA